MNLTNGNHINNNLIDLERRELELERKLKKKECEASFYSFFIHFWPVVCKEIFVDNWHIKYLCDMYQDIVERIVDRKPFKYEYYIFNVPPGSTKSLIFSVMGPAWCWIKDDTLRLITGTHEKTLATDFNVKSRDLLKSAEFVVLWGDKVVFKKDEDGKTAYSNTAGGSRKTASVGSSIVGRHAHLITIDDPLDPQKIASEVAKKKAIKWFDDTLSMRKVDKEVTVTILVMQRLAEDDPAGHILAKYDDVFHVCIPGEITDLNNVHPKALVKYYVNKIFDPRRLTRKSLEKARVKLGGRGYSNQILQFPAAADGTIWKRKWWGFYDSFPRSTPCQRITHSWDTDFGKKAATCGGVFAREYQTGIYITHIFEKSLEFPQLDQEIRDQYDAIGGHAVLIEDKASGQSEIQVLQQQTKIPVVAINPVADKVSRAYASTPFVENGKVFLPKNAPWVKKFVDMMAGFPDIKLKDIPDAFSQLINWSVLNPPRKIGTVKSKKVGIDEIIKKDIIKKRRRNRTRRI